MLSIILTGLLPSFLLVCLGGLVRGRLSENAWSGLDRLNFEILFPALIFTAATARPIDPANLLIVGPLVWAVLGLGTALRKVALNPFLLASLAGVAVGLTGLAIPAPVLAPVHLLAQAAIPVALISIGATLNWGALARLDRFSGILVGTKLIALPGAVALGALALGSIAPIVPVLVVFAALPTASAAHVLAAGFGADRRLAATLIAQSTLLSAVTLPVWMAVAEGLGR